MRYKKFIIKNFKGIREMVIDLEKKPETNIYTMVGLNESGKTTVLEAISVLEDDYPFTKRYNLIPKKEKINFNGKVSISCELELSDDDNKQIKKFIQSIGYTDILPIDNFTLSHEYNFKNSKYVDSKNYWTINIDVKKNESQEYLSLTSKEDEGTREEWIKVITFIRDVLKPKIIYYPNFLFDFPDKIFLEDAKGLLVDKAHYQIIQDILNTLEVNLNIEDHIIKRLKSNNTEDKESLDHTLAKMGAKVTQVVLEAWKDIISIKGKEIIIRAGLDQSGHSFLEFKLKEGTEGFYISERSLGFKWFFSFLLFTEFRKYRKTDQGKTVFLLDEPASNLHPAAQQKLLKKFETIAKDCFLIFTTHSHHLINPKWLSGLFIVRNKALKYDSSSDYSFDTSSTDIEILPYRNFVATYPNQQDYFKPVLDALEYNPGSLEKVNNIIITEGKFDYYIFKYMSSIEFNSKYKKLSFYPGSGANSNFQIIRMYLAWGRPFIILLDSDRAGIKAKDQYIKEFGEIVIPFIKTYTDFSPNFKDLPIEGGFNSKEKDKITTLFDTKEKSFVKSKFNSGIQQLYITNQKYNFSSETIQNFSQLLKGLEKTLREIKIL